MKHICFILLSLPLLQACSICSDKKVTCPDYEERGLSSWFPYTATQKLVFRNNSATDTIIISRVEISQSYKATVSANRPYCYAYKKWTSADNGYKLNIETEQRNNAFAGTESTETIQVYFRNTSFTSTAISDTGLVKGYDHTYNSQFYSSTNIGGTGFQSVQLLLSDTTGNKSARPYKVWISKNNGIIAYEDYPSHNLWIKQ